MDTTTAEISALHSYRESATCDPVDIRKEIHGRLHTRSSVDRQSSKIRPVGSEEAQQLANAGNTEFQIVGRVIDGQPSSGTVPRIFANWRLPWFTSVLMCMQCMCRFVSAFN
nr:hypothetical protein CFP56_67603 [Quercus suber]